MKFTFIHAKTASDIVDPSVVLGIEITDATVAARCGLGNIDGQHGHGAELSRPAFSELAYDASGVAQYLPFAAAEMAGRAAIDVAVTVPRFDVPPFTFATSRPDVDSIGAMAVLVLRSLGLSDVINRDLVATIAKADSFRPGGDWASRPLPTEENPWPAGANSVDSTKGIAHLGTVCSPRKGDVGESMVLAERAAFMALCLAVGGVSVELTERIFDACGLLSASASESTARNIESAKLRNRLSDIGVEAERRVWDSRRALASAAHRPGAIVPADGFVVVRVAHAGALGLGYCVAPVVVAFDQAVARKVTIAAYDVRYLDVAGLKAELNRLETEASGSPQWGGPPAMCSSPQNVGTCLPDETIIATVARFVRA